MSFNNVLLLVLQSAYILIPAYFANMAPPLAKRFKIFEFLNIPIDNNKTCKDGRPIFGKNKTYRGYVVGVIGGLIGAFLQMFLLRLEFFSKISLIDYTNLSIVLLLGILMGLGAITGDLIESFVKRRLDLGSGQSFVPWDQTDLVMGAYLFALPIIYLNITWLLFVVSLLASFCLHVITNHIAFYTGIRKEKW